MTTSPTGSPGPVGSIFEHGRRTLTFGIVAIITVSAFEAVGVMTSMPVTVRDLDGLPWYAWSFTAFVVTSLYAMVVAGEWADRAGPLPPLLSGAGVFAAGTLVAGVAPSMLVFLGGRALQGLGAGAVIVAIYLVIGRGYPDHLRPRMFTALSGAWVLPGIIGPAIAGSITDHLGWRWVFLGVLALMVPIVVVLVPRLLALHLPGDADAVRQPGRKRLALLAAVGTGSLQYAGQRLDWWSVPIAVLGLAALAVSVPRLLPVGALRLRRGLPTVVAERGMVAGAFFSAESFLPLLLVRERGLSSAGAGMTLSGAAIGWFLGSWYQGRPTTKRSRPGLILLGATLVTAGIGTTTVVLAPWVPPQVGVVTWGVGAFGMGVLYGSLGVLLLDLSPVEQQGVNASALQVADSLGSILCTGAAGVVFAAGHTAPGQDTTVYLTIFAGATLVAAAAAVAAPRVRPSHAGAGRR